MAGVFKWLGRLIAAAFLAVFLLQCWYLAHIVAWSKLNPDHTSFMQIRLQEIRQTKPDFNLKQTWVPYERISLNLKRAVVAAEDSGFVDHPGFEVEAIEDALRRNTRRGKVTHGGSTITQQLAKNLFLSGERSYIRKAQELVIALMIEAVWDKRRIFEVYLNVVEWGNGVFGAEAASRYYYGTTAANLNAYQAATLAGMLPAPRYFDKKRNSPYLARKVGVIQVRMFQVAVPR